MLGPAVVAETRVGHQRQGPESRGGGRALRIEAEPREGRGLGGILGVVLPLQNGRQSFDQADLPLEPADRLGQAARPGELGWASSLALRRTLKASSSLPSLSRSPPRLMWAE